LLSIKFNKVNSMEIQRLNQALFNPLSTSTLPLMTKPSGFRQVKLSGGCCNKLLNNSTFYHLKSLIALPIGMICIWGGVPPPPLSSFAPVHPQF
jgi:hypothetical protein